MIQLKKATLFNTSQSQADSLYQLKECLSAEKYNEVQNALDTPRSSFDKTISIQNYRNYWLGYNTEQPQNEAFDVNPFNTRISNKHIPQKFFIKGNCIDSQNYTIWITYFDYEEQLDNPQFLPLKTLENSVYPYLVYSKVKGLEICVQLSTSDSNKTNALRMFVELLQQKRSSVNLIIPNNLDISSIVYSITGNIPLQYKADHFHLTRDTLSRLMRYFDESFYAHVVQDRRLIRVCTTLVNLSHYFSPIFTILVDLKSLISSNNIFITCIQLIIEKVVNKTIQTANTIKEGNTADYTAMNRHLQTLLKAFIFNKEQFNDFLKTLHTMSDNIINSRSELMMTKHKKNNPRQFDNDWDISIVYRVTLSVYSAVESLRNKLEEYFNANQIIILDEVELRNVYLECYRNELTKLSHDLKQKELARQKLEHSMRKNIATSVSLTKSISRRKSKIEVQLMKNHFLLDKSPPLLNRPRNIKQIRAYNDKIIIKWDMEDERQVQSYKIDYCNVTISGDKWFSFMTNSADKIATVDSIAAGSYVFKVQANFGDLLGAPSDRSEIMSTLQGGVSRGNTVCSTCSCDSVSMAIVPCGHTFDKNCGDKLNTVCPVCGESIRLKLNLL